jgi:Ser/Thr protein kinase RdoA (MazF antagonist)
MFRVDVQRLHGGLESTVAVARISGRGLHPRLPAQFIIKQLPAGFEREADVYDTLWQQLARPPVVRVLGRQTSAGVTYLYLEHAQPSASWPWSDTTRAAAVCRELAHFHQDRELPRDRFVWNYESELAGSAEATLSVAQYARDQAGKRYWRRLGDLRRVVAALPAIRARLLSGATTIIHGDLHPGNVILRDGDLDRPVVLIDWARARVGSPLEDVASWLHSLGCWEPQARRRHDTLMKAYLDARAVRPVLDADLRCDYWCASISNGLSGAIRYHLAVLSDATASESARFDSQRALTAWTRVVRRAAALVNTSLRRCT